MTDKEVLEYNQRFIIEETTQMEEFDNEKQLKELEKFLDGFEERLTEYVKNSHAISYQMGERADKRDVYENGKLDGWNEAIEKAAKIADGADEYTSAKIRKLKRRKECGHDGRV